MCAYSMARYISMTAACADLLSEKCFGLSRNAIQCSHTWVHVITIDNNYIKATPFDLCKYNGLHM